MFNVGNRVRVIDSTTTTGRHRIGQIGTVRIVLDFAVNFPYRVELDNGSTVNFNESELAPANKFRVGDRVMVIGYPGGPGTIEDAWGTHANMYSVKLDDRKGALAYGESALYALPMEAPVENELVAAIKELTDAVRQVAFELNLSRD